MIMPVSLPVDLIPVHYHAADSPPALPYQSMPINIKPPSPQITRPRRSPISAEITRGPGNRLIMRASMQQATSCLGGIHHIRRRDTREKD